ncbi:MAG TPA: sigma-70 family RNA polymerase sigma factor [Solirubrobacteraceae bacterium]|nr:sigma-70 family RNA polymerase sigma factor [Solirubrobacteraceae bacterium]
MTSTHGTRRFSARPNGSEEGNSQLVSLAIKSAQQGESDALGFLYARYADSVYGYVRSIVHDHHEAEDITQHVFVKLIKVIGKYQEQDVPFLSWILRVARNAALDSMRNNRMIPVEEVREVRPDAGEHSTAMRVDGLRDALAALPEAQRQVLMLRHLVGLSPCEIAEMTGKSEGSIHGLHHRGRRTAAAELQLRGMAPATVGRRPS